MTDRPTQPDSTSDTGSDTARGAPPGLPRWVKVAGLIIGILLVALAAIMAIAGGDHGPGRHANGDQPTEQIDQKAPAADAPGGHDPSDWGGHG